MGESSIGTLTGGVSGTSESRLVDVRRIGPKVIDPSALSSTCTVLPAASLPAGADADVGVTGMASVFSDTVHVFSMFGNLNGACKLALLWFADAPGAVAGSSDAMSTSSGWRALSVWLAGADSGGRQASVHTFATPVNFKLHRLRGLPPRLGAVLVHNLTRLSKFLQHLRRQLHH